MIVRRMVRYGKNGFDLVFKILVHRMPRGTEENTVKPQYSSCSNYNRMFSCIQWSSYLKFLRLTPSKVFFSLVYKLTHLQRNLEWASHNIVV